MELLNYAKKTAYDFINNLDLTKYPENRPTREACLFLLNEWISEDRFLVHAFTVASACEGYANYLNEDQKLFEITGILHDFDNQRFPYQGFKSLEEHPLRGITVLKEFGLPDIALHAIISHASILEIPFSTNLSKILFAVDELSGFLVALRAVRPGNTLKGIEWSSIHKKLKDKKFAPGCDRGNIQKGADLLGFNDEKGFKAHILRVADFVEEKMVDLTHQKDLKLNQDL